MQKSAILCPYCIALGSRFIAEAEFSCVLAKTFRAIEESSASGCALCRLIRQHLIYGTRANISALRKSDSEIRLITTLEYVLIGSPLAADDAVVLWPRQDLYLAGETDYEEVRSETECNESLSSESNTIHSLQSDEGLGAGPLGRGPRPRIPGSSLQRLTAWPGVLPFPSRSPPSSGVFLDLGSVS